MPWERTHTKDSGQREGLLNLKPPPNKYLFSSSSASDSLASQSQPQNTTQRAKAAEAANTTTHVAILQLMPRLYFPSDRQQMTHACVGVLFLHHVMSMFGARQGTHTRILVYIYVHGSLPSHFISHRWNNPVGRSQRAAGVDSGLHCRHVGFHLSVGEALVR